MITIQFLGVMIGLAAIHISYIYYKRSNFTKKEVLLWVGIWGAFIFVSMFPNSIRPLVGYLGLQRPMDFIMIVAFIVLFSLTFHNYMTTQHVARQTEKLVRTIALSQIKSENVQRR